MHNGWDMFSDMESHFIPIDIFATCILQLVPARGMSQEQD